MNNPMTTAPSATPRLLITGMTSLRLGAMTIDNLGNMVILEPMLQSLRDRYPDSRIQTTMQLAPDLAAQYKLEVLTDKVFWQYDLPGGIKTCCSVALALIWRLLASIGFSANNLGCLNVRFAAIQANDVIFEFNGDMFGDFALNRVHFLTGILNPLVGRLLRKRVCFIASSPGPFSSAAKAYLAKWTFGFFDLVSVREPESLALLYKLGLRGDKFQCHPCFSFGFKPASALPERELLLKEPRLQAGDRPLVGIIVCSLSLPTGPAGRWPRDDAEFTPFLRLIRHLVTTKGVDVCLLSHRNKFNPDGRPTPGSDHSLVERLLDLARADFADRVFALNGVYDAATSNRIIGKFKVLISGRIHGAVQAISQGIPTLIIDYGMEPRAHKLKGFAQLCGLSPYVCDLAHEEIMVANLDRLWSHQDEIAADLSERMPSLIQASKSLWDATSCDPAR